MVESALKLGPPSTVLIFDTQVSARRAPRGRAQKGRAFVLIPLDALVGDDGIVAALRKRSNWVAAVA
jgi:hypothetical protein